mgnify:CR=1 FL=1|jgi:3-oxoadipate enol-lactonase
MPRILANGVNINYLIEGAPSDQTVMFSNSLASNLSMWDLQAEFLIENGFRLIRYDTRGHGASEVPEGPYSIEMLADDVADLIEKLGLGPLHFCGLSMGGMVAQMMGARHPNKILSLTIADSAAFMPAKDTWQERILTVKESGMAAVVDGTAERWITEAGRKRLPSHVCKIREMILKTDPLGFVACSEAIRDMDLRSSNPLIKKPTLVICGEEDTGTTPLQAKEIADAIPGAKLQLISDAAHLTNIEQAKLFNSLLLDQLKENS